MVESRKKGIWMLFLAPDTKEGVVFMAGIGKEN